MKFKTVCKLLVVGLFLAAPGTPLLLPAHAQAQPPPTDIPENPQTPEEREQIEIEMLSDFAFDGTRCSATQNVDGPVRWMLLWRHDVLRELKLDRSKKKQIAKLRAEMRASLLDAASTLPAPVPLPEGDTISREAGEAREARLKRRNLVRNIFLKHQAELNLRVNSLLTPSQKQRLNQLSLQWKAGIALAEPQVANALRLSKAQRDQVEEEVKAYRGEQFESFRVLHDIFDPAPIIPRASENGKQGKNAQTVERPDFGKLQLAVEERCAEVQQAVSKKLLALLTPEQAAQLKEMQGAPFSFDKEDPTPEPKMVGKDIDP